MKKSELRQIIREEINRLHEGMSQSRIKKIWDLALKQTKDKGSRELGSTADPRKVAKRIKELENHLKDRSARDEEFAARVNSMSEDEINAQMATALSMDFLSRGAKMQ